MVYHQLVNDALISANSKPHLSVDIGVKLPFLYVQRRAYMLLLFNILSIISRQVKTLLRPYKDNFNSS
jgi:hypothetical protein